LIRGEPVDDLVVSGEHTTPNSDAYRRAVLISVYGELIRRSIPLRRRFYRIHRRQYLPAYPDAANSARHWLTSRIPSWKERLVSFSQRCGRSIYTPFLSAAALES